MARTLNLLAILIGSFLIYIMGIYVHYKMSSTPCTVRFYDQEGASFVLDMDEGLVEHLYAVEDKNAPLLHNMCVSDGRQIYTGEHNEDI